MHLCSGHKSAWAAPCILVETEIYIFSYLEDFFLQADKNRLNSLITLHGFTERIGFSVFPDILMVMSLIQITVTVGLWEALNTFLRDAENVFIAFTLSVPQTAALQRRYLLFPFWILD